MAVLGHPLQHLNQWVFKRHPFQWPIYQTFFRVNVKYVDHSRYSNPEDHPSKVGFVEKNLDGFFLNPFPMPVVCP